MFRVDNSIASLASELLTMWEDVKDGLVRESYFEAQREKFYDEVVKEGGEQMSDIFLTDDNIRKLSQIVTKSDNIIKERIDKGYDMVAQEIINVDCEKVYSYFEFIFKLEDKLNRPYSLFEIVVKNGKQTFKECK